MNGWLDVLIFLCGLAATFLLLVAIVLALDLLTRRARWDRHTRNGLRDNQKDRP